MTEPFLPLPSGAALDAAVDRSTREPVLIFKHSATCGISAQAHEELTGWLRTGMTPPAAYIVHLPTDRIVSNIIADRFRIRHESPQALLLADGIVRWHGSHWRVNPRELQPALDRLAASAAR